jgi:hypothetical protein
MEIFLVNQNNKVPVMQNKGNVIDQILFTFDLQYAKLLFILFYFFIIFVRVPRCVHSSHFSACFESIDSSSG